MISLTYAITLTPSYSPADLRSDMHAAVAGVLSSGANTPTGANGDGWSLTTSHVGDRMCQLFLRLPASTIGLKEGRLARLLTMILGPSFRGPGFASIKLTHLEIDDAELDVFEGPALGSEGLTTALAPRDTPYIAVPLPSSLGSKEWSALCEHLISAGVTILVDSPLENTGPEILADRLEQLAEIAKREAQPIAYFANLTLRLTDLFECVNVLLTRQSSPVLAGARICPFSIGLNVCEHLASNNVPVYGYNALQIGFGRRSISTGVLASLLRISGADLITLGVTAIDTIGTPSADEAISAMTSPLGKLRLSTPVLTGAITPRVAHRAVDVHGSELVLHTRGPILRGSSAIDYVRNVGALREAVECAKAEEGIDNALGREANDTKHWRSYEEEFGKQ